MQKKHTTSWVLLVFLFFTGWVLIYTNRTVLSPLLSVIEAEWTLSPTILGLTHSVFFLVYTAMQIPAGLLADKSSRKLFLVGGFLLQGIGATASGFTGGINTFLAARFVTGLGQSSYYANQYAIALNTIPARYRALGASIINSGIGLGMALGMCFSSWLVYEFNFSWRLPFIFVGACTVLLVVVMHRAVQETGSSVTGGAAAPGRKLNYAVITYKLDGVTSIQLNNTGVSFTKPKPGHDNTMLYYTMSYESIFGK